MRGRQRIDLNRRRQMPIGGTRRICRCIQKHCPLDGWWHVESGTPGYACLLGHPLNVRPEDATERTPAFPVSPASQAFWNKTRTMTNSTAARIQSPNAPANFFPDIPPRDSQFSKSQCQWLFTCFQAQMTSLHQQHRTFSSV